MKKQELIAVHEFCMYHNAEVTFIQALGASGLVEVIKIDNEYYVNRDQLPDLEKLVRFRYEMDINIEGVEAIHHLLQQIHAMQHEMQALKSRVRSYERLVNETTP